ncbi:MAG: hypothetical protein WAL50_05495 [Kineosporiaceae bacterium]
MTAPTSLHPQPRRTGVVVLGLLLAAAAVLNGLPMLLALLFDSGATVIDRALALALVLPGITLVLLAGITAVHAGMGRTGAHAGPTSLAGRWASGMLGAAAIALMAFAIAAVVSDLDPVSTDFFDNLWLAVPLLAAWVMAAAALVTSIVAALRRDRSAAVLAILGISYSVTVFGVGEAVFPH